MNEHVIDFRDLEWQDQRPGVRFKSRTEGGNTMRLVEFSNGVVEHDWCLRGHMGYILDGDMEVDFGDSVSHFRKGDGLYIAEGTRHRASVPAGVTTVVIFVEKA